MTRFVLKKGGAGHLSEQQRAERGSAGKPALVYSNASSSRRTLKDQPVYFDRKELAALLNLYGKKVSAGVWRDYAMDFLKDRAMFSVYQRNSERPMFIIEKQPKLRGRQGQYLVINQTGRILKRGHELGQVLKVLEPQLVLMR